MRALTSSSGDWLDSGRLESVKVGMGMILKKTFRKEKGMN
jgi:hypothetical protein